MHLKCAYYNIQWITSIQGLVLFSYISHQRKCFAHYRGSRNICYWILFFILLKTKHKIVVLFLKIRRWKEMQHTVSCHVIHTVTLSSAGDWLFVQSSVTQSCPTLRYGMDCSALPYPSPSPRACSNSSFESRTLMNTRLSESSSLLQLVFHLPGVHLVGHRGLESQTVS